MATIVAFFQKHRRKAEKFRSRPLDSVARARMLLGMRASHTDNVVAGSAAAARDGICDVETIFSSSATMVLVATYTYVVSDASASKRTAASTEGSVR